MAEIRVPRNIGTDIHGNKVSLPPEAATQGFGILGKRGTGKSTLAADIIEIFAADGIPFVVFDPPGAHWGIRFAAGENGEPTGPSGFPVLLIGGDHGDIPLEQTSAQDLARIVVETNLSCVIDLKAMNYTGLQRYYADFAEELFKINRTVRYLLFEEAQNVAPQNLKFDEQKRALYATEKLIDEGRGIGLGFGLVTQRPAAVNKSVLTQIDHLYALGMFAPQDLDQIEGWFANHVRGDKSKLREIMDSIAQMKRGECWHLSPDGMVKFHVRNRVTYHAGRTPKPGERVVNVDKFSITDAVSKLKKMFTTKQVARKQEVADLNEAKKRIRELEKQARHTPSNVVAKSASPQVIERAVAKAVKDAQSSLLAQLDQRDKAIKRLTGALGAIARDAAAMAGVNLPPISLPRPVAAPPPKPYIPAPSPVQSRPAAENNGDLSSSQMRILKSLAQLEIIDQMSPPKEMVAFWSEQKSTSGGYFNNLGKLRSSGLIHYPQPGTVALTAEGRNRAGGQDVPDSDEVMRRVKSLLSGSQVRILDVLVDAHPESIAKDELAEKSGQTSTSGGYFNNLGAMRTAGLIEYPQPGQVKASDWLIF